jgi:hypothetical protein
VAPASMAWTMSGVGVVGGQHEHSHARVVGAEAAGGLDTVELGHAQVHEHHIGFVAGDGGEGLVAVRDVGDDLEVGLPLEHAAQAVAHDGVVIDDQDTNRHGAWISATRVVPPPGVLSTSSLPPSAARRLVSPSRPAPPAEAAGSNPAPSSVTVSTTRPGR